MNQSNQPNKIVHVDSMEVFVDGAPLSLFLRNSFYQLIANEHERASASAKANIEKYAVCDNCTKDTHVLKAKYCSKCGFALNDQKDSL